MNKELFNKLKSDPRFIPFNDKFDYNYIKDYLQKIQNEKIDIDLGSKALSTIFFNQYYIDIKKHFTKILEDSSLTKEIVAEALITLANRDFYLLLGRALATIDNKKIIDFSEISNYSFKSVIPELGNINVQSAVEAGHDSLNILLNILRNSNYTSNITLISDEFLRRIFAVLSFSNIYTVIKFCYDSAIWDNHSIKYNSEKHELLIEGKDKEALIINKIGEHRLERNISVNKHFIVTDYLEKGKFYKLLSKGLNGKRKPKRLKKVTVSNNELKYKLADGIEKKSVLGELMAFTDIISYYQFISNEKLPNLDNLSLYDIITIFTEIQYLLQKTFEIEKVETENSKRNYELFKLYTDKKYLIEYVYAKTKYSNKQIGQVLSLLTQTTGHYNIWERPLIAMNNKLIPIFLPIISPNTLRLIDYWLEQGGFDLDQRGPLFETYIKEVIKDRLGEKGYYVNIPKRSDFYNKKNEKEEIDLIIELKNIIVIGEIKCIRYPFDPRDYHNMLKRLKEGVNQVKRKTKFLKENSSDLEDNFNSLSKEIVSIVITNYPIYSGLIVEDIPIIDFSLIENYFIHGSLNKSQIGFNGKKRKIMDRVPPIVYYTNEDEFSRNLTGFLNKPIPVEELRKNTYIEKKQVSLPDAEPRILMDYALFKESVEI